MGVELGSARVVVTSAARTTTGTSAAIELAARPGERLNLLADATAASGTTPTLDLTVEWSMDDGTTWAVAEAADSFTQITAAKTVVKQFAVKALTYRIRWTIAGTTPSFTFSVSEHMT